MPNPPFDTSVQNNFPMAAVIQAAQENASRQQQAQEFGQQSLIQGLQSIGQVGQSLLDRKRAMAQAMTMGAALGIKPEEVTGLMPDQIDKIATIKASQMDTPTLMAGLAAISGNPIPFSGATPASGNQPGNGAVLTDSEASSARPSTPMLPPHVGKTTAEFLMKAANDARLANQFKQGQSQSESHFQTEEVRRNADKQEKIVQETEDKNQAIYNAANAIKQSLDLKRQAASGPMVGRGAAVVGNLTGGALGSNTYQLIQHNMRNAPTLQHAQEVNRFNPQEVQYLNTSNFSQPAEPLSVSQTKAYNVAKTFATRLNQNEVEKAQKMKALGVNYTPRVVQPEDLIPSISSQNNESASASNAASAPPQSPTSSGLVHLSTQELMDLRKKMTQHTSNGPKS